MNLLCQLGRHRPGGIPRWNDGFYFAACERCGCDLVRTAFGRWHVPEGYRVVWSERPPVSRPEVALVPETNQAASVAPAAEEPAEAAQEAIAASAAAAAPAAATAPEGSPDTAETVEPGPLPDAPAAAPVELPAAERPVEAEVEAPVAASAPAGGARLPIQDVLAQLHAEEAAERTAEAEPAPEAPPVPAAAAATARPRRSRSWDFMEEESGAESAPAPASEAGLPSAPRAEPEPAPTAAAEAADSAGPEAESPPRAPGRAAERWRSVRASVREFWSGPSEPNPLLAIGLALGIALLVAAAMVVAGSSSRAPEDSPAAEGNRQAAAAADGSDPFAAAAPEAPLREGERAAPQPPADGGAAPSGHRAYVAASLLSCRAAPVLQARRVRSLARGQEVRMLGLDGEWASLAYRGGQCWAQARFISPAPPL